MKAIIKICIFLIFSNSALGSFHELRDKYIKLGGNPKALAHLNCIKKNLFHEVFETKPVENGELLQRRCNNIEGGKNLVSVNNTNVAIIVDYTKTSQKKRLFILDLHHKSVSRLFVSHGSYKAKLKNKTLRKNQNSIRNIKYFSNEINSNASTTGLHLTGIPYKSSYWSGPKKDKYSMVLHGLEKNINDNSCERLIVVHGNNNIRESGLNSGVREMSRGCFMVDYNIVNKLVRRTKGTTSQGGSLFFVHGPREEALADNQYCQEDFIKKHIRLAN